MSDSSKTQSNDSGSTAGDDQTDMEIGPGTVVAFHYDLYDDSAEKIETSKNGEPVLCLHGERGVLLALQEAFVGRVPGDDFSITIPHEKAYGRHYPDRVQRMVFALGRS